MDEQKASTNVAKKVKPKKLRLNRPRKKINTQRLRRLINSGVQIALSLFLLGFLVYLIIANMAFMGFLPKRIAYKLPFISSTLQKISAQEHRVTWAKERISAQNKIKQIGELDLDIREEADVENAEQTPPFLYRFRVIRNRVEGKEFSELWIDNVQIMRILVGQGNKTPYIRTKQLAQRLYDAVNFKADFNELQPLIVSGCYSAMLGKQELFQVSREDAIGLNTTPRHLLYQWINSTRVAMGVAAIDEPPTPAGQDLPAATFLLPATPKLPTASMTPTVSNTITISAQSTINVVEEAKKKRLKLAAVYEKMDINALPPIFTRMNNKSVEESLLLLSDRMVSKLFVAMPPDKVAVYYKELTRGTLTDEPEKNFQHFIRVWEKVPPDDTLVIWKHLSTPECKKILDKMSVKKKSKLLSTMQASDATMYLKLMQE